MSKPNYRLLALLVAALYAAPISSFAQTKGKGISLPKISAAGMGLNPVKLDTGIGATIGTTPSIIEAGKFLTPSSTPNLKPVTSVVQQPVILPAAALVTEAAIAPNIQPVLNNQVVDIQKAIAQDPTGSAGALELDKLYFGKRHRGSDPVQGGGGSSKRGRREDPSQSAVFIVNDEGVEINGRAAEYYKESRRLVDKYQGTIDMTEALDVMDDTYAAVHAKLKVIETVAKQKQVSDHNTHLEQTLVWVDGTMTDAGGKKIAVHTHQVYFHHAPEGPNKAASEIAEGIRRTDKHIEEMVKYFSTDGKAEEKLGTVDEVVLGFDTRGYQGIKDHLKQKEKELAKTHGKKYRFVYFDEVAKPPKSIEQTRAELNVLIKKYKQHGLQKIVEGVIYSRYVGLLLELKTLEHFHEAGWEVLQAGHELFDGQTGHYITELDTVVRSPEGKVFIVEAKSARVSLEFDKALEDKVLYKLRTYKKNMAEMERLLGTKIDGVMFSVDVGHEVGFQTYLEGKKEELTEDFGKPVDFIFLQSGPEEDGLAGKPGKKKRRR